MPYSSSLFPGESHASSKCLTCAAFLSFQARLAPKKKLSDARPDADGAWRLFHNAMECWQNDPPAVCAALLLHFALALLECMTGPVAAQVLVRHDGATLARSLARLFRLCSHFLATSSMSQFSNNATFGERKKSATVTHFNNSLA